LQTKEFDGSLKPGMHGCVVTYAKISSSALLFQALCSRYEVMVVFDEIHHAGDEAAWGKGLQEAFEGASRRLALSGTPWRTDGVRMPFLGVDPETGQYEYNYRFDWPAALEEPPPAIRLLAFRDYHGSAEYEHDGQVIRLSSRDPLSDEDAARCLRGRLLEQRFASDVLRDAHAKLMELRETKPDAGGLVVCMDIGHAENVAQWLGEVTGERVVIAVSDDGISPGTPVEDFADSSAPWIVSVRQVSEGVDIPRLMVGVYLTNYVTELFFRQFVGRVARNQGTEFDKEAYVYIPHHPTLIQFAQHIKELQTLALSRREAEGTRGGDGDGPRPSSFTYLGGSDAELGSLVLPNHPDEQNYTPEMARTIASMAKRYNIPETTAARIIRDQQRAGQNAGQPAEAPEAPEAWRNQMPLEERLEDMRTAQNRRVGFLARLTGRPYDHLNNEANEHVGCASVKVATEEQLQRRAAFIEQSIRNAKVA
jgi:superfamily II DNA or RNA helicase